MSTGTGTGTTPAAAAAARVAAPACAAKPWADPSATPHLRLGHIVKRFGSFTAIDDVSLDIFPGEFFALLGPSGCGKTTLLRMMAGFETPDEGQITLAGQDLTAVAPHERPVNMMFQSYALFPHLSVEKNIAFGLKMERMAKADIAARVDEMLALTRLEKMRRRRPDQLSGGQRQRVALARALAKKPKLILLDEPLGALDRKLREATQFELVRIQETLGLTFVIVTHDQEEAMTVSTRIAVMEEGRIAQIGEPQEIYEAPISRYVAEFIGDVNVLEGQVENSAAGVVAMADGTKLKVEPGRLGETGSPVAIALRPEKIEIALWRDETAGPADNSLSGTVEDIAYLGDMSVFHVRLDSALAPGIVRVARTNRIRALESPLTWESRVRLSWDAKAAVVLAG